MCIFLQTMWGSLVGSVQDMSLLQLVGAFPAHLSGLCLSFHDIFPFSSPFTSFRR